MDGTVLALFSIKFKHPAAKIAFFCFPTKVLYIFCPTDFVRGERERETIALSRLPLLDATLL